MNLELTEALKNASESRVRRQSKREKNREAMPQVTQWVDEIRELFGEPESIKAEENGIKVEWKATGEK